MEINDRTGRVLGLGLPVTVRLVEVTPATGGKLTGRAIATLGYRGMHSYELFFDDFFVPAENMLGGEDGEGKGF